MSLVSRFSLFCLLFLAVPGISFAQESPPTGPEFDKLKEFDGYDWDATIRIGNEESKGTLTSRLGLGGRWMNHDFQAVILGQKFSSQVFSTYDSAKKKYVSVNVTSIRSSPLVTEGNYDASGKVMTMTGEATGPDGKPVKVKIVTETKDRDTVLYTEYGPGPDGKEVPMAVMTFKRRK